jgi:hypothetical protein
MLYPENIYVFTANVGKRELINNKKVFAWPRYHWELFKSLIFLFQDLLSLKTL